MTDEAGPAADCGPHVAGSSPTHWLKHVSVRRPAANDVMTSTDIVSPRVAAETIFDAMSTLVAAKRIASLTLSLPLCCQCSVLTI